MIRYLRTRAAHTAAILFVAVLSVTNITVKADQANEPPLTLWAEKLPNDFRRLAANVGLNVTEVEHLAALGAYIITIHAVHGQGDAHTLQLLSDTFPSAAFERLDGPGHEFELIEN